MRSARAATATTTMHYWGIHPAYIQDFYRGNFHRRKAKAKAKLQRSMQAAMPEIIGRGRIVILQWPSTTQNSYYPSSSSSELTEGTSKAATNDLKFNNINNLLNIHDN